MGQNHSAPADDDSAPQQNPDRSTSRLLSRTGSQSGREHPLFPSSSRNLVSSTARSVLNRTRTLSRRNTTTVRNGDIHNDEESEERPLRALEEDRVPALMSNNVPIVPRPRPVSMSALTSNVRQRFRYSTLSNDTITTIDPEESDTVRSNLDISSYAAATPVPVRRESTLRRSLSTIRQLGRSNRTSNRFSISRPILQQNTARHSELGNPDWWPATSFQDGHVHRDPQNNIEHMRLNDSQLRTTGSYRGPRDIPHSTTLPSIVLSNRLAQRRQSTIADNDSGYLSSPSVRARSLLGMDEHSSRRSNPESNVADELLRLSDFISEDVNDLPAQITPLRNMHPPRRSSIFSRRDIPSSSSTSPLHGRSSRMIRRDDDTPLSRILSVAATAIATQLSGNNETLPNFESVGDDQLEGNLISFVEELHNAPGAPGTVRTSDTPHLNFWRVFRFPNHNEPSDWSSDISDSPRTVTVVVVGVRSVPSSTVAIDSPTLNASSSPLSNAPRARDIAAVPGSSSPGNPRLLRRGAQRSPINHHQTRYRGSIPLIPDADLVDFGPPQTWAAPEAWATPRSGSPPGSFPPPSTPADRLSVLAPASVPPEIEPSNSNERLRTNYTNSSPVRRRRSDSEAARQSHLRSDDTRRHGVIGAPHDHGDSNGPGRSWLIYVIGTHISEDSPMMDMPSLFDLNGDSYEDMLRLQEIIGPHKPPTASAADLSAAGGLFVIKVRKQNGVLLAEAVNGRDTVELQADATCIICQEAYALNHEIRRLGHCPHFFHRECIDEWLLTGKNSCPLCRNKGVERSQDSNQDSSGSARDDVGHAI